MKTKRKITEEIPKKAPEQAEWNVEEHEDLFTNLNIVTDDHFDSDDSADDSDDESEDGSEEDGSDYYDSDDGEEGEEEDEGEEGSNEDSFEEEEDSEEDEEETGKSDSDEDKQQELGNNNGTVNGSSENKHVVPQDKLDEYEEHDTSDEEDIRNTVGNIPMNWYDEYKHLGYDWDGKQIIKPSQGDQLDAFLKRLEDPDFWRTVKDSQTGQDVVLSEEDIKLIRRIQAQRIPDETFKEYAALPLQTRHNQRCTSGQLMLEKEETRELGLARKLIFRCDQCDSKIVKFTEDCNKKSSINVGAVWGTLTSGSTYSQLTDICASLDIPAMTYEHFKKIKTELGEPWIEWFTSEVMKTPVRKFPEHKRSFLPSRSEAKKVSKLVHALKMGWIKTKAEQDKLRAKKEPQFYMLWDSDDKAEEMRRIHKHIAAPKRHLPGHAESYNPPPEYLFDTKELKQWNKQKTTPWKRKLHFVPQQYDSLRKVPAYPRFIKERFLRCLDLYLCPRAYKMRLTIEPEDLVPKLPSPKDLQPFPTVLSLTYEGHKDMVRTISVDKFGQYLVSGSDDTTVKIWEVNTGRCLKTIETEGIVHSVEWCPNTAVSLILVASGSRVLLINPHVGDFLTNQKTDEVLKEMPQTDEVVSERIRTTIQWELPDENQYKIGIRLVLKHFKEVKQVTWHGKGDYFASVMPEGLNRSVLISQLSKRRSQIPFTKSKGLIQCVLFHPIKPFLFVATQRHVRIYDLVKQTLMKKLMTNSKWVSKMAVHPGGDNLLVGTYDRKMLWFDLDLSTKPYQTLRLHGTAVRGVAYHKRYPLFASGSDDRSLIVSHGMVYNDLLKNPLIVPLKRLQDHEPKDDFGIFDVTFHPLQPWVFSAGADSTIRLYTN